MKSPMDKDTIDRLIERLIEELQAIRTTVPADGDVLRSLYDGELYPAEMGFLDVSGYKALARKASETSSEVFRLTEPMPEMRRAFDAFCDVKGQIAGVENFELFARGFGLGVRLVVDGLCQR